MNNITSQSIEDIQKTFKEQWNNYNDAICSIYSIQPMLITAAMEKKLSVALNRLTQIKSTIDGLSDRELQMKTFIKICKIKLVLAPIGKIIESCQDEHKTRMTYLLMGYLKQLDTLSSYESNLKPGIMLNKIFYQYLFIPFKKITPNLNDENIDMSLSENSITTLKHI